MSNARATVGLAAEAPVEVLPLAVLTDLVDDAFEAESDTHDDTDADFEDVPAGGPTVQPGFGQVGLRHRVLTRQEETDLALRIEAGLFAERLLAQEAASPTAKATLAELTWLAQDGTDARYEFAACNQRLVYSVARPFLKRGLTPGDVLADGNLGLARAVVKFDYRKGFKFSTYATWWIRQAITTGLNSVRQGGLSEAVEAGIRKVKAIQHALEAELGREPTLDEVAARGELTTTQVRKWLRLDLAEVSLDGMIADDMTRADFLPDASAHLALDLVEDHLDLAALRRVLDGALCSLTPTELQVVRLRFGLGVPRTHTLTEVGAMFGVSRERIRQIEANALARLRDPASRALLVGHLRPTG